MVNSTYDLYPVWELASGHTSAGAVIPGKRNRYPEGAAAGLYTNVMDLCKLVGHINTTWAAPGDLAGARLNKASVMRMLTPGPAANMGRGWFLENAGRPSFSYSHTGSNYGFNSEVRGFPALGTGYAVLVNGDNSGLVSEISAAIRAVYGWN